eukprot:896694-Rhodomonas_salina.6
MVLPALSEAVQGPNYQTQVSAFAMPGTDLAYAVISLRDVRTHDICLRARYAMPGTDPAYGATRTTLRAETSWYTFLSAFALARTLISGTGRRAARY